MRRNYRLLVMASMTLVMLGCFGKKKPVSTEDFSGPLLVHVRNNNWSDIVVYSIVGGKRQRVGMVTAINQATLTLKPGSIPPAGLVELLLDPLGSNAYYRTGGISVGYRQEIRLVVENELRLSSWSVQ